MKETLNRGRTDGRARGGEETPSLPLILALAAYQGAWKAVLGPLSLLARLDLRLRSRGRSPGALHRLGLPERLGLGEKEGGPVDRGTVDCGPLDRGTVDHGPVNRGTVDRGPLGTEPVLPKDGAIWFHCASLGEAKGLAALARHLLAQPGFAGVPAQFTCCTASGLDFLARSFAEEPGRPGHRSVTLAPFDEARLLRTFLRRRRIRAAVFYEFELWPGALAACRSLGIPMALVSGRLPAAGTRTLSRYHRLGLLRHLLSHLDYVQAQGEAEAGRFGPELPSACRLEAGADFKWLHYLRPSPSPRPSSPSAADVAPPRGLAFLSLHLRELEILLPVLSLLARGNLPMTVFPRYPSEITAFRRLLAPAGFVSGSAGTEGRLLLVDSFGRVPSLLPGHLACFVGASFLPLGGHNPWEPFMAGCFVLMGPHHHKQASAVSALKEAGFLQILQRPADLLAFEAVRPPNPEDRERLRAAFFSRAEEAALRLGRYLR